MDGYNLKNYKVFWKSIKNLTSQSFCETELVSNHFKIKCNFLAKKSPRCSTRGLMALMLMSDLEVLIHVETFIEVTELSWITQGLSHSQLFFHYYSGIMFDSFASLLLVQNNAFIMSKTI